jgi:DNA polymerase delta subunit 2
LTGSLQSIVSELVTGVVIALKGQISDIGEFVVNDHLFSYEVQPVDELTEYSTSSFRSLETAPVDGKYLLFLSGLQIGIASDNHVNDVAIQLLVDFLSGKYGDENFAKLASRISRVIIAGDSVVHPDNESYRERFSSHKHRESLANPSKQLDLWLAQLLSSVQVDIMPGSSDPANISLPQQPFHSCLFPHSSRYNTFERVSNPNQFKIDNVEVLGHSGQPVSDIVRQTYTGETAGMASEEPEYVPLQVTETVDTMDIDEAVDMDPKPVKIAVNLKDVERRMDILQHCLEWGHIAPTLPGYIFFF